MSRYTMKKYKKNNKTFTVINEQKEIVATINGDCNIKQSVVFSSKVTIVASTTNYSKYKKQEELYIRRIDSLFK